MRRNQHIGLRDFKWKIIALPIGLLWFPIYDAISVEVLEFLPDPFFEVQEYGFNASNIQNFVDYHWKETLKDIVILFVIFWIIVDLMELAVRFGFMKWWRKWGEEFLSPIVIISIVGYFGFYKTLYLGYQTSYSEIYDQTYIKEVAQAYGWASVGVAVVLVVGKIGVAVFIMDYIALLYRVKLRLIDNPAVNRLFTSGFGGSARWAHVLDYEKRRAKLNSDSLLSSPFLGNSLFDDDPYPRPICLNDDAHLVTVGMTGSGKSTTVLYNNLALYNGSVFVFDPKGELARNTLRRRDSEHKYSYPSVEDKMKKGKTKRRFRLGNAYALDPFNEIDKEFGDWMYNPLEHIDLEDDRASGFLNAISNGCMVPTKSDKDIHWTEWAKNIIEGLIIHVISRYPKENHNLPFILDVLTGNAELYYEVSEDKKLDHFNELMIDMITNEAFGGLPSQIASQIMKMGDNEKGSVLSTTYRSLKWVGEPAMRKQLVATNIDLTGSYPSVYVILPSDMIGSQMRWVRVIMGSLLVARKEIHARGNSEYFRPDLFIFDEFGQLGESIDAVTDGFPILRGFNIKLWVFVQSLSQLKSAFGDKWNDVISASTVQVFGVNDSETSEWISKRLGARVNVLEDGKNNSNNRMVRERVDPLLTPDEVEYMLGKEANVQIVFPTQGRPMRLERVSYKPLPNFNPISFNMEGCFEDW